MSRRRRLWFKLPAMTRRLRLACLLFVLPALSAAGSSPSITIELSDYVALPVTGDVDGGGQTDGMLARVNSLREEPGGASRFFVNDLNGPLSILDKKTKAFTTYLDFNGRSAVAFPTPSCAMSGTRSMS